MNASKENARLATSNLNAIIESQSPKWGSVTTGVALMIREFLVVAEKKLPTEAAFEADKKRRHKQKPATSR